MNADFDDERFDQQFDSSYDAEGELEMLDPEAESEIRPAESLSFLRFWGMLVFSPQIFFRDHFQKQDSPYFWIVLLIVGISGAIDRYERQLEKIEARGDFEALAIFNTWTAFWVVVLLGGFVGGYFYYYLGGWWFDVRVGWSGGIRDIETSRFICLYSAFIPAVLGVAMALDQSFRDPRPMFLGAPNLTADLVAPLFILTATFYAMYVSYRGVRTVTGASRWGARTWFLILPGLFLMLVISLAIAALALVAA